MTHFKQNAGLLRSVWRWGVLGLLLALAVTLGSGDIASAQLRTIDLNTGLDQWNTTLITVGQRDSEWRVTMPDPLPPPSPGSSGFNNGIEAFVVDDAVWVGFNPNLPLDFPNSRWISINTGANSILPAGTSYTYEFYFTLPPGVSSPQLTMKASSDDVITNITLNGCNLSTFTIPPLPAGDFQSPPVVLSSSDPACFATGPIVNVLTVTVEDTFGALTGLIVDGKVTYEDCDRERILETLGPSGSFLQSITFVESTFGPPTTPTFTVTPLDLKLTMRIPPGSLNAGNFDFDGVPGAELYDVFISDWDGTPNPNGQFITIEAVWPVGAPSGGGLNIAAVRLNFFDGSTQLADSVSSFVALGDNALPLNVGNAVDGEADPILGISFTDTTMGNTINQETQRLRVTVGFPCPCAPPPSSMTAWWPLDELPGKTAINDIAPIGVNNVGTPTGGAVGAMATGLSPFALPGMVGGALGFTQPAHVAVGNHPELNFSSSDDLTIDAWVFPVLSSGGFINWGIVSKADVTSSQGYALVFPGAPSSPSGPTLRFWINGIPIDSINTMTFNQWHHVAVTYDRIKDEVFFYIDGAPDGPYNTGIPPNTGATTNTKPLLIGGTQLGGATKGELHIDEVEIFKRALTPNEILSIFNAKDGGKCKDRTPNHYLGYTVRPIDGDGSVPVVRLKDQFGEGVFKVVRKSVVHYNPVDKKEEGIPKPEVHQVGYALLRTQGADASHTVDVTNQFGTITVTTANAERLLVPSTKTLGNSDGLARELENGRLPEEVENHFLCYGLTSSQGFSPLEVTVADQFKDTRPFSVLRPIALCNPVTKEVQGEGGGFGEPEEPVNEDFHLLCYGGGVKTRERFEPIRFETNNQFGFEFWEARRDAGVLCVPSEKIEKEETGACCIQDACVEAGEETCAAEGGAYQGDGTECVADLCTIK